MRVWILLVFIVCSSLAMASDQYLVDVDVRESSINYEITIKQSSDPIRFSVPADASSLDIRIDGEKANCLESTSGDRLNVACIGSPGTQTLVASFHTRYRLLVFPETLEFKDSFTLREPTDRLEYRITLPSGVITDISQLEYAPSQISVDGSRLVLVWVEEPATEFSLALTMKRAAVSYTLVIILALLGGIALGALGWWSWQHRNDLLRSIHKLQRKMDIDGLTKVYNRASFDRDLSDRVKDRRGFVLAMVDIDHFKQINDTQGHQAGDEILKKVARTLKRYTRSDDSVYRYGGEEFAVILEHVTDEAGKRVLENLRYRIKTIAGVTASIGAQLHDGSNMKQLIERADKALYHAKETGRNRVVFFNQIKKKE